MNWLADPGLGCGTGVPPHNILGELEPSFLLEFVISTVADEGCDLFLLVAGENVFSRKFKPNFGGIERQAHFFGHAVVVVSITAEGFLDLFPSF